VYIAHDRWVVRHVSDLVAVMYLGTIVEMADRAEMYEHPLHPYTHALLSVVPVRDPANTAGGSGSCARRRYWKAEEVCRTVEPSLVEAQPGHQVACHFPEERELV
jgi:peptide/nickel transport system ATP-binding protein/oligopeptide transport system ATP-binding protein